MLFLRRNHGRLLLLHLYMAILPVLWNNHATLQNLQMPAAERLCQGKKERRGSLRRIVGGFSVAHITGKWPVPSSPFQPLPLPPPPNTFLHHLETLSNTCTHWVLISYAVICPRKVFDKNIQINKILWESADCFPLSLLTNCMQGLQWLTDTCLLCACCLSVYLVFM